MSPLILILGLSIIAVLIAALVFGRKDRGARSPVFMAPPVLPPDLRMRVQQLLAEGKPVTAVKEVRQATGLGLADAKRAVDAVGNEPAAGAAPYPNVPTGPGGPGGPAGPGGPVGPGGPGGPGGFPAGPGSYAGGPTAPGASGGPGGPMARGGPMASGGPVVPGGPGAAAAGVDSLADRARRLRDGGDFAGAVALVRAETGMGPGEADRFVTSLR